MYCIVLIYFTSNVSVGLPIQQMSMHFTLSKPMPSVSSNIALCTADHVLLLYASLSRCAGVFIFFHHSPLSKAKYDWPRLRPKLLHANYFEQATELFCAIFNDAFSGPYYVEPNDRIIIKLKRPWKEMVVA
jgi:hypothetical protein